MRTKPAHVLRAIHDEDTEALRAMGRMGGKEAAETRRIRAARVDIYKAVAQFDFEQRQKEDYAMRKSANEDVLSPDGEYLGDD